MAIRERDAVASWLKAHAPSGSLLLVTGYRLHWWLLTSSTIGLKCEIDLAGSFVTHTARGFILFEMSGIRPS